MKVGDLVQWTFPGEEAVGIVLNFEALYPDVDGVLIHWFDGEGSGTFPLNHHYIDLISEGR